MYDRVELVAVDHKIPAAVRGAVNRLQANLEGAKHGPRESAYLVIVIAGDVDDARAVLSLREQFLDDLRLRCTPARAPPQPPEIDYVAGKIDRAGVVRLKKAHEILGPAGPGRQMDIGKEEGAVSHRRFIV